MKSYAKWLTCAVECINRSFFWLFSVLLYGYNITCLSICLLTSILVTSCFWFLDMSWYSCTGLKKTYVSLYPEEILQCEVCRSYSRLYLFCFYFQKLTNHIANWLHAFAFLKSHMRASLHPCTPPWTVWSLFGFCAISISIFHPSLWFSIIFP